MVVENASEQGTLDWQRQRLGKITSSRAGVILQKSTTKGVEFGGNAQTYLNELLTDRMLSQDIIDDDEQFELYLFRKKKQSFEMRWGSEREREGKLALQDKLGIAVSDVGYKAINGFCGDSSDGVVLDFNNKVESTIEGKSPSPQKHLWYCENIITGEDLIKIPLNNKEYYTQCQLHNLAWGADICLWYSFDYMCRKQLHIVEVKRDNDFIEMWLERAELANNYINQKVEQLLNSK